MATIEGQIEPLKKIKIILQQNGITRFGSIGEIHDFIKHYEEEKNKIPAMVETEFETQINQLKNDFLKHQQFYDALKEDASNKTKQKIRELQEKLETTQQKRNSGLLHKMLYYPKVTSLMHKKGNLEKNFENIVSKKIDIEEKEYFKIKDNLNYHMSNRDVIISGRRLNASQELENTKAVIDSLYNLIAGAIGENAVIKEVQKLSDSFHLFNDFSVQFQQPIYNKKDDDRIYSIQIDHLLVCEAGIFILETKNWGKQSVNNIDLRSPVKQILRSSYALFVLLNSQSSRSYINLGYHHWGSKRIAVRNVIVMTSAKPKEEFNHVKVLSLKELNGYLTYFDPILNSEEVKSICDFLRWISAKSG